MRPFKIDVDPANAVSDGLADNNDSSGASLTLDGTLTSGGTFTSADGLGHRLSITDTATQVQTDSTFTITGTDADGKPQVEALAGPGSAATVESTKYFLTVTSVTIVGGDALDTVDMGTVDEVASPTQVLDFYANVPPTVHVDVTGTVNYDIQVSAKNIFDRDAAAPFTISDQEDFAWVNDANFAAKTADLLDDLSAAGVTVMRVVTNSYTATAELQVYVTQPSSN
jgi:hypothetical protein